MNTQMKEKAAYDLAMEHIRQNNRMKESNEITLENQVKHFQNIYNEILSYLNEK